LKEMRSRGTKHELAVLMVETGLAMKLLELREYDLFPIQTRVLHTLPLLVHGLPREAKVASRRKSVTKQSDSSKSMKHSHSKSIKQSDSFVKPKKELSVSIPETKVSKEKKGESSPSILPTFKMPSISMPSFGSSSSGYDAFESPDSSLGRADEEEVAPVVNSKDLAQQASDALDDSSSSSSSSESESDSDSDDSSSGSSSSDSSGSDDSSDDEEVEKDFLTAKAETSVPRVSAPIITGEGKNVVEITSQRSALFADRPSRDSDEVIDSAQLVFSPKAGAATKKGPKKLAPPSPRTAGSPRAGSFKESKKPSPPTTAPPKPRSLSPVRGKKVEKTSRASSTGPVSRAKKSSKKGVSFVGASEVNVVNKEAKSVSFKAASESSSSNASSFKVSSTPKNTKSSKSAEALTTPRGTIL
jgi:hypothetical protein